MTPLKQEEAMFVITGAGKTGRVVANTLLRQGKRVRVVVRGAAKAADLKARGAEVALASLDDAKALGRALEGAVGFYTLLPEDLTVAEFHGHRHRMADAIAAAVKRGRVPNVVLLSASAAALPDGNGPAADLHYAENTLRATGAKVTALRASYFQENVAMALAPARHEGVFPSFFPADMAFATAAARDVGMVAARSLLEPHSQGEILDVVGPMYSNRQLAEKLGAALGKSLRVAEIPQPAHVSALVGAGLPEPVAKAMAEMFACFASGRVTPRGDRMIAVNTTVEEILPALVGATS